MKRVITFLMFAMLVVVAASNVVPERTICPDVDVGYIVDTNNDIIAETTISENVMFTMNTIGTRQEGVAETTIRSGPITSEGLYFYDITGLNNRYNDKPAIVFRV